jgi:hypothetical protein
LYNFLSVNFWNLTRLIKDEVNEIESKSASSSIDTAFSDPRDTVCINLILSQITMLKSELQVAQADIDTIRKVDDEILKILESDSSRSLDVDKKLIHLQTNILLGLISNTRKR